MTPALLLFDEDAKWAVAFREALVARNPDVAVTFADTFDEALAAVRADEPPHEVLVIGASVKALSAEFLARHAAERGQHVVSLGDPGLEHATAEGAADAVLARLGIERSQTVDVEVVEQLANTEPFILHTVRWPGIAEPVLRAQLDPRFLNEASLIKAQQAGVLRGPGLAETLESFWYDPRPHVIQVLPSGVSLEQLLDIDLDLTPSQVCAIGRGVAEGLATLHAHDFSTGSLDPNGIWLCSSGEVLLLGGGLRQARWNHVSHLAPPGQTPPEELAAQVWPELPGDSFRLGHLLLWYAGWVNPLRAMPLPRYLAQDWSLGVDDFGEDGAQAPEFVDLVATLMQPHSVDRPRGRLVGEVIERVCPTDWRGTVREVLGAAARAPTSGPDF